MFATSEVFDNEAIINKHGCRICKAQATGFHFDAQSCSACAAFFRRTVTLQRRFKCATGNENCVVHYSLRQICRACRFRACLAAGMNKNSVQPKKPECERRRSFYTKSGLKRNKKFAIQSPLEVIIEKPPNSESPKLLPHVTSPQAVVPSQSLPDLVSSVKNSGPQESQENDMIIQPLRESPNNAETFKIGADHRHLAVKCDVLQRLVAEEMKLSERRRIMFCERPVGSLLGMTKTCPFNAEEIRPLRFRTFRKSIRTHILLIYEWIRSWPNYDDFDNFDQITFLRKCVLYHTVLDPSYITIQIGYPNRFVMQNGGYVAVDENRGEGWEDEEEISGETKQRIYRPLLRMLISEVVSPMVSMNISFEEFVALKAFVSWQGTLTDISEANRPIVRSMLNALCKSLHQHYEENNVEVSTRLGNIILLLSSIFATALQFVESHHEIAFFDLWQLDSLLIQFLKCKYDK